MTSERPVTSASQYLFASVSPHRAGTWDEREQGRVSAPLGWHCHPCLDTMPRLLLHHLLCLSAAQGPSLRQETIAFPPASRTLGKPPGQPAEQISGASRAGTEHPPHRAGEAGICRQAPSSPWPGANPPQRQAPSVSCAHGSACRGEPWGQGPPAGRVASPAPRCRRAGPASRMEGPYGGLGVPGWCV